MYLEIVWRFWSRKENENQFEGQLGIISALFIELPLMNSDHTFSWLFFQVGPARPPVWGAYFYLFICLLFWVFCGNNLSHLIFSSSVEATAHCISSMCCLYLIQNPYNLRREGGGVCLLICLLFWLFSVPQGPQLSMWKPTSVSGMSTNTWLVIVRLQILNLQRMGEPEPYMHIVIAASHWHLTFGMSSIFSLFSANDM